MTRARFVRAGEDRIDDAQLRRRTNLAFRDAASTTQVTIISRSSFERAHHSRSHCDYTTTATACELNGFRRRDRNVIRLVERQHMIEILVTRGRDARRV